jgi:hypothetical protein
MARIEVEELSDLVFRVTVDDGSKTEHEVTLASGDVKRLGAPDAMTLLQASFEFLLQREPKESILPRFELSVIGRYFPEWEEEMRARFG